MGKVSACPAAVACIRGGEEAPRLRGTVNFYGIPGGALVTARIQGLPENETGFFALHIHEGADCRGAGFPNTGGHFNPGQQIHPLHVGDLPPLLNFNGKAFLAVETGRFTPAQVVGKTVVIHYRADDFHSQPAGNPGKKIGCGVIRRN